MGYYNFSDKFIILLLLYRSLGLNSPHQNFLLECSTTCLFFPSCPNKGYLLCSESNPTSFSKFYEPSELDYCNLFQLGLPIVSQSILWVNMSIAFLLDSDCSGLTLIAWYLYVPKLLKNSDHQICNKNLNPFKYLEVSI